ncbi:cation channel sperm-associated protein subunit gamma [Electrophorus electricus]|nr:cation channel sperm-associated protein subunit gamma [Electrophorus electricus]
MALLNGSVVHRVKVMSNGLGENIPDKTFAVNVNGYIQEKEREVASFTLGKVIPALEAMMTVGSPSRPLWAVVDRTPVLVLPGIPEFSALLLTANEFQHTALIEVATESPWARSLKCPELEFSFMVQEAIATESTIFIRHKQLLYRFTGNYSLLPLQTPPSDSWELVLGSVCISSLMPVAVPHHGREYFYVLGQELENRSLYRAQIYGLSLIYLVSSCLIPSFFLPLSIAPAFKI